MKRLFICLLLLVPVMTFAGCSKGNDEPQAETPDTPDNPGDNEDNDDDDGSGTVKPGSLGSAVGGTRIMPLTWMPRPEQALSSIKEPTGVQPRWWPDISKRLSAEICI